MSALLVRPGDTFGRWVIVQEEPKRESYRVFACRCACGTVRSVYLSNLTSGKSLSCGCLRDEAIRRTDNKFTTHGMSRHALYLTWRGIQNRCHDKRSVSYTRYGGRGISCYWDSIEEFVSYVESELGPRPSDIHTLDRIDNSRGYEPGNLRWATPREQALNRRSNKVVAMWGELRPLQAWCDLAGISSHTVKDRITSGWDVREAILTPLNAGRGVRVEYDRNSRPDRMRA